MRWLKLQSVHPNISHFLMIFWLDPSTPYPTGTSETQADLPWSTWTNSFVDLQSSQSDSWQTLHPVILHSQLLAVVTFWNVLQMTGVAGGTSEQTFPSSAPMPGMLFGARQFSAL
jgi:hypothetical protein